MLELNFVKQLGQMRLDVDLRLPESGIIAIFGRSGAGKTSFINIVSGLSKPDEGHIAFGKHVLCDTWQGIDLPPKSAVLGMFFRMPDCFRIIR